MWLGWTNQSCAGWGQVGRVRTVAGADLSHAECKTRVAQPQWLTPQIPKASSCGGGGGHSAMAPGRGGICEGTAPLPAAEFSWGLVKGSHPKAQAGLQHVPCTGPKGNGDGLLCPWGVLRGVQPSGMGLSVWGGRRVLQGGAQKTPSAAWPPAEGRRSTGGARPAGRRQPRPRGAAVERAGEAERPGRRGPEPGGRVPGGTSCWGVSRRAPEQLPARALWGREDPKASRMGAPPQRPALRVPVGACGLSPRAHHLPRGH